MTQIWKFALHPWRDTIDVPRGAQLLSAGAQGDDIVVWAVVDVEADVGRRRVFPVPTGVQVDQLALEHTSFVNTVQMPDGLVFHVFDGGDE